MQHPDFSRRNFLELAAATSVATSRAQEKPELRSSAKLQQFLPNLFVFEDTCNVYVLRRGRRAILIDFGSGSVLDKLPEINVDAVDWILHTHHHRDQAQGDYLAVQRSISIAVPEHERQFFDSAENFWRNRRVFELYDVKNDFFSLTQSVPVRTVLRDYETWRWQGIEIFIQPAPGHTPGSIALIATLDGKRVAFTGDLIFASGKVPSLYDLQYNYAEHEGVDLSIYSLQELIKHKPDFVCPSHGDPIEEPVAAMNDLSQKLRRWHAFWYKHPPTSDLVPYAVSPHLVASTDTTSSFYTIISRTGKALLVDYGGASWTFFQVYTRYVDVFGHMRFLEHTIDKLRSDFGVKSVDVVIPTHIHDDHLNGVLHLKRRYGTQIWALDKVAQVTSLPRELNTGCIFGEPIPADRTFRPGETFQWEEYTFTMVHSPGHTDFQMAMFGMIDGARVAFTGDAFFGDGDQTTAIRHNLIYRNQVKTGDYLKSIQNVIDFGPDLIAPGHGKPFPANSKLTEAFRDRVREQDQLFRELVADVDTDQGIDPSWLRIEPYQAVARRGEPIELALRLRNHRARETHIQAVPVLPNGWICGPSRIELSAGAKAEAVARFTISIPESWAGRSRRVAFALDVMADGKYLGQITEAVIDFASDNWGRDLL